MSILLWIALGALAGWMAGLIMGGEKRGVPSADAPVRGFQGQRTVGGVGFHLLRQLFQLGDFRLFPFPIEGLVFAHGFSSEDGDRTKQRQREQLQQILDNY